MQKMLRFLMSMVLVNAVGIFAVTWQMDSSPFSFPGTGVGQAKIIPQARVILRYIPDNKGKVVLMYQLPYGIDNAALKIYNLRGNLVASFHVKSGSSVVQWSPRKNNVTSGVYMASLRYGREEAKIKLSILE